MPDRRTIGDVGEFALIDAIRDQLARSAATTGPFVRVGSGDDAAILSPPAGHELAWTCDTQIAGRHFLPAILSPEEIGARAMQICLSDLAAMGAQPRAALISLSLPPEMRVADVLGLHDGFAAALAPYSAIIAGGNFTRIDDAFVIDLSAVGSVPTGRALERSGAKPGDIIFVSGCPGASAAGLSWIRHHFEESRKPTEIGVHRSRLEDLLKEHPGVRPLVDAYLRPRARVDLGLHLVDQSLATAAIDISDGWGGDLLHVCKASGVRAVVRLADFPREDLQRAADALLTDAAKWQLGPSDDYELLFTAPPSHAQQIRDLSVSCGMTATVVGRIEAGPPEVDIEDAAIARGWDHFGGSDST